jgi:hypothetical protein
MQETCSFVHESETRLLKYAQLKHGLFFAYTKCPQILVMRIRRNATTQDESQRGTR